MIPSPSSSSTSPIIVTPSVAITATRYKGNGHVDNKNPLPLTSEKVEPSLLVTRSRERPMLVHSNNLHSGSFLEMEYDDNDSDGNDDTRTNSRDYRNKHGYGSQSIYMSSRNRFLSKLPNHDYPEDILGRIVSDTNEWGKFHNALRQKRKRCCTHASIQQYINQLLLERSQQEQEERVNVKKDKERKSEPSENMGQEQLETAATTTQSDASNDEEPSPSTIHVPSYRFRSSLMCNDREARQRRVYQTYLKAVVACRHTSIAPQH